MITRGQSACALLFVVVMACALGCNRDASTTEQQVVPFQHPTSTALWANRQVDLLLADDLSSLRLLAEQLVALAVLESGDPDLALLMEWSATEEEAIWRRVYDRYDTEWIRGYMIGSTRSAFVYTLMSLYVRAHAPELSDMAPGAFDDDAKRWPVWIETHKLKLGHE